MRNLLDEVQMDKRAFSMGSLTLSVSDHYFWLARTATERLKGIEILRQALYGYDSATSRLQRVLEVAQLRSD
jgi:hypothetical protein